MNKSATGGNVCRGLDVVSGAAIEVSFDRVISIVDHLIHPLNDAPLIAPGWIDLQVNGFAGVDYNSAETTHEQIAQSIRAMFACGVTRFFPTVITGSPDNMSAALRNLANAKESVSGAAPMEAFHLRRSVHLSRRRPARRTSRPLGSSA